MGDIVSNLESYWPCNDNAASTVVDDIVGTNDGTLTGAGNTSASTVSGPGGRLSRGLSLDFTNDNIALGTAIDRGASSPTLTASLWFNPASLTGTRYLMGRVGSPVRYVAITSATNILVSTSASTNNYTVPTMSAGKWYHLAITRAADLTCRCWFNGAESSTGGLSLGSNFSISEWGRGHPGFFGGSLSGLRFYTRELVAADIADLYAEGLSVGPLIGGKLVGGHLTRGRLIGA